MTIDILCKVVDNYGDIGLVYRLARALSELEAGPSLRLIVDDLHAFERGLQAVGRHAHGLDRGVTCGVRGRAGVLGGCAGLLARFTQLFLLLPDGLEGGAVLVADLASLLSQPPKLLSLVA